MRRALITLAVAAAATLLLFGQTVDLWGLFWNGSAGRWAYYRLGSGFTLSGNTISVQAPPAAKRVYGAKLNWSGAGYILAPGTASNVAVWVNGLRYLEPDDYTLQAGSVTPACTPGAAGCNWPPPESRPVVVADYEVP
jgi:hypothetical protein